MGRAKDFIEKEKSELGSLLYNINGAITEIAPFIEEETLKSRKYYTRIDSVKELLKYLEDMLYKEGKDGIFGFLNDSKRISEVESTKNKYFIPIRQLENCSKCKCLSCIKTCNLDSCSGCREGAYVRECNKDNFNTVVHDNFILNLSRNEGESARYNVLATMQDVESDKRYIIIQNIEGEEKLVLYYYPDRPKDKYGKITDSEEIDFVAKIFEKLR